jgi:putative ABC transport system ATP-binding protein
MEMITSPHRRGKGSGVPPAPTPDSAPGALVALRGVGKTYASSAGPFTALRGIDLAIGRGEFVAVVGKSGSGKSTLLNLLAGIDRPTEGEVRVSGVDLGELDEAGLAAWRGRALGLVFQFFQLLPTLTALENVLLPMDFANMIPAAARRERALALLARTGVADQASKLPASLSGGQQQRVAIARALANDPALLLADEPTGNLDEGTTREVLDLFRDLVASGRTVVMVTHERDARMVVDRTISIADGRIVEDLVSRLPVRVVPAEATPVPARILPVGAASHA